MPRGGYRPGAGRKPRRETLPATGSAPAQSLAEAKRNVRRRERTQPRSKLPTAPTLYEALSVRERRFVEEYLIDLNASAAYLRAGFKGKAGKVSGLAARLIARDRVAQAIAHAMAERSKRTHIDQDRVLLELGRIGFSDVRNIFEPRAGKQATTGIELYMQCRKDDRAFEALPREAQDAWHAAAAALPPVSGGYFLKAPDQLDDATAASIAGVEVVTKSIGDGEVEYIHKIKTVDKTPALTLLGRHLGMWHEKGDPKNPRERAIDESAPDEELLGRMEQLLAKARGKAPAEARA